MGHTVRHILHFDVLIRLMEQFLLTFDNVMATSRYWLDFQIGW